jgi:hypothetical protein
MNSRRIVKRIRNGDYADYVVKAWNSGQAVMSEPMWRNQPPQPAPSTHVSVASVATGERWITNDTDVVDTKHPKAPFFAYSLIGARAFAWQLNLYEEQLATAASETKRLRADLAKADMQSSLIAKDAIDLRSQLANATSERDNAYGEIKAMRAVIDGLKTQLAELESRGLQGQVFKLKQDNNRLQDAINQAYKSLRTGSNTVDQTHNALSWLRGYATDTE